MALGLNKRLALRILSGQAKGLDAEEGRDAKEHWRGWAMLQTIGNFFTKAWSLIKGFPGRLVRNRTTLIVAILVILVAGGLCWRSLATKKRDGGYVTAKVAYGNIQETVSASGEVDAVQSVTLTFESSGYVEACNVKMGDAVKAGQVLAVEQSTDLQTAVDQANANLDSAQASYDKLVSSESQQIDLDQSQVDQAEITLDNAKSTLDQDNQLLGIGAVSQNDVNTAKSSYQSSLTSYKSALLTLAQDKSQSNILAAAAAVKNAQAALTTARENLTNAEITAPFDGYISSITGSAGQWTGSGTAATSSSNQFEIVMTSTDLQIVADVNEADISEVSAGQTVSFTVDTYPNDTFTGKIASLSPSATTVSNVQMYEAIISIDDYSKLKSGLPATIDIITSSANHVLVVPRHRPHLRQYLPGVGDG